ncbi:MAG TPA: nucleoside-diphosphate sugar epimerase/dehydratase [Candidatus Omnitrophota bacterium]|nr:nucleoside-diphosphate sugar epimerase/dehydratase [Candidatus Omnitrophota bacterium]HQB12537.1 nucleoside-diphosphate sugar epimerase/dehydratase [Candidatus Omnitrophota bacterium]
MLKLFRINRGRFFQVLIDAGLILFSLVTAYALTEKDGCFAQIHIRRILLAVPFFLVIKLAINTAFRIYRQLWRYIGIRDAVNIFKAVSLSNLVLMALFFSVQGKIFSPTMFALDWVLCLGLFSGVRFLRRYQMMKKIESRRAPVTKKKVLLYGAGSGGELILRRIQGEPSIKMMPVGFIDDDPAKVGAVLHGVEVLGSVERIKEIIERFHAEEILITSPTMPAAKIEQVSQIAKKERINIKIAPSFYGMFQGGAESSVAREIDVQDLLGRNPVVPNVAFLEKNLNGKRFLVTGGCGSIGKELVKQIARYGPGKIIVVDVNETGIFWLDYELSRLLSRDRYALYLCDVRNVSKLEKIIDGERPEVIYHAAAYKHVPISAQNPSEYVSTNVLGTKNVIDLAQRKDFIKKFCLVSTDKAVNPVNVMGVTKRMAELLVLRETPNREDKKITFVRFGNVLGSRGSVVPLFKDMIEKGGPVKVTHPDVERYFMDLQEAVHLVLQAPFFTGNGAAFILDMGTPVKIQDLARLAIRLSGLEKEGIRIEYTGLRPGEKITEELYDPRYERWDKTDFEKIAALTAIRVVPEISDKQFEKVNSFALAGDDESVYRWLKEFFPQISVF